MEDEMNRIFTLSLIIIAFVLSLLPLDRAEAIPAFARKYKISCSTCHVAIPKLKAYGDEFAGNGFLLPDGEEPKRAYVNTGDESLTLMRDLPLAIRFDAYIQASDRDNVKTDLEVPFGLKILSGGPISKYISYYFYFYLSERGEVAGVEDAILFFNNIGNTSFDIAVGQFQISDPLYKRELRLTFEDYQIYRVRPGNSKLNLTYDRGIAASYGFDFGMDLIGMVVNGNGIKAAGEDRLFDLDNNKTYALRVLQSFDFFSIGLFGAVGKETVTDSLRVDNNIAVFGPDLSIGNEYIEFNAQYLYREDDNVYFETGNSPKVKSEGGFVELTYMPKADQSLFLFTLLYNYIDSEPDFNDYQTATFSISHMAARNVRFLAEFTYDFLDMDKHATGPPKGNRFTIGAVTAF
jgi:hypothetical protein